MVMNKRKILVAILCLTLSVAMAQSPSNNTVEVVYNGTTATVAVADNVSQYLTVTVEGYQQTDSCMAVLTERQIDSIPITRNRITVCRGNLFSREASATRSSSFSFTVENEWEEGQTIFF